MKQLNLFSNMTLLSWCSIGFFISAKITGMIGVCLGFLDQSYHNIGGFLLLFAIISIFISIGCSLLQMFRDRKKFEIEDIENIKIQSLSKLKIELEKEIKELKEHKIALKNLKFRKGIYD